MSKIINRPLTVNPTNEIIGFSGSPRVNGNSDLLLKSILAGAHSEDIPTDCYNLTNIHFQGCIGCEKCRKSKICTGLVDGMSLFYPKVISSIGLVLVSPTHNYNITAWMKAFIDRLYCFYNFENNRPRSWSSQLAGQNRKAIIGAICEQAAPEDMGFTLDAMRRPLEALGYEIVDELAVFKIFDKGKVESDNNAMNNAYASGKKLAKSID